jgi:putative SOS response-associated peptidase YedK
MCGRYTLRSRGKAKPYGVPESQLPLLSPRYNIAPSQDVPVILERKNGREMALLKWGLVPSWTNDAKGGANGNGGGLINARTETLERKPSFAESFLKRRCLIPADGFYEWKRSGKWKQPFFFQMKDESPFAFAGIWDKWQGGYASITSCAIITTTPNELLATIHDRMPVILTADAYDAWLRDDADPRELRSLLAPYPAAAMKSFPVSTKVNSALVDEPQLVEPVELKPEMTTGRLF